MTYLFVTLREGWNGPYVTYRCRLRDLFGVLPPEKRPFVPPYYATGGQQVSTWFEIAGMERLTRDEMNRITVISSGRSIMSVIGSTAATFRVYSGS